MQTDESVQTEEKKRWTAEEKLAIIQRGRWHQKVSTIAVLTVPPRRRRVGLYFSLLARR